MVRKNQKCFRITEQTKKIFLRPKWERHLTLEPMPVETTKIAFNFNKLWPAVSKPFKVWTYDEEGDDLADLSSCLSELNDWNGNGETGWMIECAAVPEGTAQPHGVRVEFPDVAEKTTVVMQMRFLK